MVDVNYIAILVAAIASMAVGFVWYGVLFKKKWMVLMGFTPESIKSMKMSANMAYTIQFAASLVMAYVLAHVIVLSSSFFGNPALSIGLTSAFFMWLGFVAPVSLSIVLWENKSWHLRAINASHYLAVLLVMGVILALWQ